LTCDTLERKTCIISIRSGAFVFFFSMTLINMCLGLLTFWLIIQSSVTGGCHIYIFLKALQMENDRNLFTLKTGAGPFVPNHLHSEVSTSSER
jgi:hypothetical protein